jgi:hypothetical protein
MEQITVLVQDTPGALADICEAFGRNGINIKAISAEGLGEAGIIHIITGDMNTAKKTLTREGYIFSINEIVAVRLPDRPGELGKITRKLADESVNIQYIYILGKEKGKTDIAFKVREIEDAKAALEKYLI